MARKDDILRSFLTHELLETKYNQNRDQIPQSVREALSSDVPIIKAIAIIVDSLEKSSPESDKVLQQRILQFLNAAI